MTDIDERKAELLEALDEIPALDEIAAEAEVIPIDAQARAVQLILDLEGAGALTPIKLDLPPELSFAKYEAVGGLLGRVKRSSSWWIGDWLIFGEGVYGERFAQATIATGLEETTLQGYAFVCRGIPPSRRKESLPFSAHRLVASMDPKSQTKWLTKAEKNGWTTAELADAIRDAKPEPEQLPGGEQWDPPSELEAIGQAILRDAKRSDDPGFWLVPDETITRLRAALGEEE